LGKGFHARARAGGNRASEVRVEAVCEALVERRVHAHVEGAADCVVGVKDGSGFWRWAKWAKLCDASSVAVQEVETYM
jgi:hypothetical protein